MRLKSINLAVAYVKCPFDWVAYSQNQDNAPNDNKKHGHASRPTVLDNDKAKEGLSLRPSATAHGCD